jgi:hypothetical protein
MTGLLIYIVGTFVVIGICVTVFHVAAGLAEHYYYRKHNGWMSTYHVERANKIGALAVIALIWIPPLAVYAAVTIW